MSQVQEKSGLQDPWLLQKIWGVQVSTASSVKPEVSYAPHPIVRATDCGVWGVQEIVVSEGFVPVEARVASMGIAEIRATTGAPVLVLVHLTVYECATPVRMVYVVPSGGVGGETKVGRGVAIATRFSNMSTTT
jgi:hypothetical protein